MPSYTTRRKSYKTSAFPTKETREDKNYYSARLKGSSTTTHDSYSTAVELLRALRLTPLLLAKVNSDLHLRYTLIAYCVTNTNNLELWEVCFDGKLVEAYPYKLKDAYVDNLIQSTYLPMVNLLMQDRPAVTVIAPGILFKPLIEVPI